MSELSELIIDDVLDAIQYVPITSGDGWLVAYAHEIDSHIKAEIVRVVGFGTCGPILIDPDGTPRIFRDGFLFHPDHTNIDEAKAAVIEDATKQLN